MKLSVAQRTVADDNSRFRVLVSGRRFGKTTLGIREICYHASQAPDQICWAVLPSYRQAKHVWWDQLKTKLFQLNWVKKANEAELSITLKNNSKICLRGADNFDSLRGAKINFLVCDETAQIPQAAWYEVMRPMLADTKGKALFCGTPKGIGNWLYDLYQEKRDGWSSHTFTTIQGGFVDQDEIDTAKTELDTKTFNQEFNATFETYSGVVMYGFKRAASVKDFHFEKPKQMIHVGIDFNVNPISAVISVMENDTIYVIDEIEMYGSNTEELCEEIHTRFPGVKIFAYPDPSCKQRRTSAGGRTDLSILQNAGFICKVLNKHMPIRDRINSTNSRLCNGNGERKVFIHPKCRKLISAMERQVYKPGTSQPEKDTGFDHINDAFSYFVSYMYPITRQYNNDNELKTWSVKVGENRWHS